MGKNQPSAQCDGKKIEAGMIRWVDDQAHTFGFSHNRKHDQCELEGKSKMMFIIQWSCNLFEIFS
jgi:hypothetical protein